jgi:hypothetical protein
MNQKLCAGVKMEDNEKAKDELKIGHKKNRVIQPLTRMRQNLAAKDCA